MKMCILFSGKINFLLSMMTILSYVYYPQPDTGQNHRRNSKEAFHISRRVLWSYYICQECPRVKSFVR